MKTLKYNLRIYNKRINNNYNKYKSKNNYNTNINLILFAQKN